MNIAIILAISSYDKIAALPGCVGDSHAMQKLLSATNRFSEMFVITETKSDHIREQLIPFLDRFRGENVHELLFYYSGHGYITDDFLCCASDFNSDRPQTTSISNNELDDLFRRLNPKLVTKIVDACQSGMKIIKDTSALHDSLARKNFKDYIYFASCMDDQSSFASPVISDFTKEFVSAVKSTQTDIIRYIHIQNYLIDTFAENTEQSPYFIVQGTGREIFANNADIIRGVCDEILNQIKIGTHQPEPITHRDLLSKLHDKDKEYPLLEEATANLTAFKDKLVNITLKNKNLEEIYDITLEASKDYYEVPAIEMIAKNVSRTPVRERLVEVIMEGKMIENVNPITGFPDWPFGRKWKRGRPEPADLVLLANELPMVYAVVHAQPRFKCIDPMSIGLVFIPFRTTCRIFWTLLRYRRSGWDQFTPDSDNVKWTYSDFSWGTLIEAFDVAVNLEGLTMALIEHVEAVVGVQAVPEDGGNG